MKKYLIASLMIILSGSLAYAKLPTGQNVQTLPGRDYNAELLSAVKSGNFADVARTLNFRANPNQKIDEYPLVVYAIKNSQPDIAALLIDKGADASVGDKNRTNALHWAAWKNYTDLVQKCIDKRVNINLQIYDGSTALMLAVYQNHEASVNLLLRHAPGLDYRNTAGKTAVMLAVEQGFTGMAIKLINHGANLRIPDNNGYTPLMVACKKNTVSAYLDQYLPYKLLQFGADYKTRTPEGYTALKIAIQSRAFDAAVLLMEQGATE